MAPVAIRFAVLLVLGVGLLSAAIRIPPSMKDRDMIITDRAKFVYVEKETAEGILFRQTLGGKVQGPLRWSQLKAPIEYKEMRGESLYKVGLDALKSGNYVEAAQRFESLAAGEREWQKAYGFIYTGQAWEAAGAYDRAAAAFGRFAADESLSEHRWFLDALYYQGVNLARKQMTDEANAVASSLDSLAQQYRKDSMRSLMNRCLARKTAISCAIKVVTGQERDAIKTANRIVWPSADKQLTFHWGRFWAGFLREQGLFKDAASEYKRLLGKVDQAHQRAILSLGYGICLAQSGKLEQAQLELLKLDALPYGSPEERLQARFWAGKVKYELALRLQEDDKEKRRDFGKAEEKEARRMLKAAAASPVGGKYKDMAAEYVAGLPLTEEEQAAADAAAAAAAEAEAEAEAEEGDVVAPE